ncbi:MAG: Hsp20/alpha crystallin family protein [Clostridiaceae bacterium]|jgi:HSP20 family protein|nr:Hsp20/alpha crystallin family protein [Clostridiaceae bacterium]
MSLIPWNPFREMDNFSKDVSNFFDFSPFRFFGGMNSLRADVYQTEKDVIVKAEIPGISKEDLEVYIDEDSIRLSGQSKRDKEYKDENIYRTERYYGSFSRTIPLPMEVKTEQASAEYKDGILSITVPKAEPSKLKGKRINIQ